VEWAKKTPGVFFAAEGAEIRLVVRPSSAGTEVAVCAKVALPADLPGREALAAEWESVVHPPPAEAAK
jgi:hypothetical protein